MFTTLIGKYKPDSDLATVTDDSSSFPPSVSPQRVAAIGNARQRLSLSTLHGFVTQATADVSHSWRAADSRDDPFGETGITPRPARSRCCGALT